MNTNIVLKCVFCLYFAVSASSVEYRPEGGPVYVNPVNYKSSEKSAAPVAPKAGFLTQTVYGFLDFTTTIGNTVMVFSPQSSAVEEKKEVTTEPIVTKPEPTEESQPEINPSRPIQSSTTEEDENSSAIPESSVDSHEPETEFVSSIVSVIEGPQDDVNDDEESDGQDSIFSSPDDYENEPIIESSRVEPEESEPSDSFSSELVENTPALPKVSSVVSVQSKVVESSPQVSSVVNVVEGSSSVKVVEAPVSSSIKVVEAPNSPASEEVPAVPAISVNNIENKPEYDFLSRQPTEIVDETYEVFDLNPSAIKYPNKARSVSNDLKSRAVGNPGKGNIGDGYQPIGKYAQVVQSTSHVYQPDVVPEKKPQKNIKPSATARILKTSAPHLVKHKAPLEASPVTLDEDNSALPLEALFSSSPGVNLIRQSRRPAIGNTPAFKNRFSGSRNRNRDDIENKSDYGSFENNDSDAYLESDYIAPSPSAVPAYRQKTKNRGNSPQNSRQTFKYNSGRQRTQTPELATVSVFNEQASAPPSGGRKYQSPSRRPSYKKDTGSSNNLIDPNAGHSGRRGYKPKVATSGVEQPYNHQTTSLYKFKLTRPTGRWQYKTSPKPRVTIRRQDEHLDNTTYTTPQNPDLIHNPVHIDPDQDISGSGSAYYNNNFQQDNENAVQQEPSVTAETIKVEISTPADFRNVYYEIATIKSPYSFQVGTVKNTRFITVTSTIEKSLVEPTQAPEQPLVENILATTQNAYDKEPPLDSSIATLPPIGLAGEAETPPLETMTETFSTTQLLLKTHILPVIRGGANTTSYTLVQSYHVTRLVTAIKTLPPMEVYQFVPSKTLNEFNTRLDEAGSELNLDIEFGDQNEEQPEMTNEQRILLNSDNIDSIGSDFDVTDLDKNIKNLSNINSGENHLRLKKAHKFTSPQQNSIPTSQEPPSSTPGLTPEQIQQLALLKYLNPAAAANLPNAITTSKPIIKVETVYESHVIPLINGANTIFTTISRPVSTVSKTEYEMVTSSIGFPQAPVAPLFPPLNPFAPAVTTTPIVTQTMVTQTESKVLKLTFGAKTAFTTLYSTKVVPTMLTTYLTNSIPTQATAAPFNPFFQQPYAPFPFLG